MIKVLIADDQQLIRQSLKIVLENAGKGELEVTGTAGDGAQVLMRVREQHPDVILMDIRMPNMDGVVCTREIKRQYPDIKIIILTTFDDDEYVFDALRYGASGYLLKGISTDELIRAIQTVYQGEAMINPRIASKVLQLFSRITTDRQEPSYLQANEQEVGSLTDNEWKIIGEVAQGKSNNEIAEDLNFSKGTVRNYLSTILEKLELRDRTQLAIWAVQRGRHRGAAERDTL